MFSVVLCLTHFVTIELVWRPQRHAGMMVQIC